MRSTLIALSLLLSSAAYAADQPAGDVPSKDVKEEAKKTDTDTVKATVEEDAQPVRRSIPLRGRSLSYTVTPGHLTIRNDKGEPTASMFYVAYTVPSARGQQVAAAAAARLRARALSLWHRCYRYPKAPQP